MTVKERLESVRLTVDGLKSEIKTLGKCVDIADHRSDYIRDLLRRMRYLKELLWGPKRKEDKNMDETKRLEADVCLTAARIREIRDLLAIDDLETVPEAELDAVGAKPHDRRPVYEAKFPDGSVLSYELCSGSTNYWGDVVWTSPDKTRTVDCEPEYELDCMEVEIDGVTYAVDVTATAG